MPGFYVDLVSFKIVLLALALPRINSDGSTVMQEEIILPRPSKPEDRVGSPL